MGGAGRSIGRYFLLGELASGGMSTVYLGRLTGPGGFTRTVAIKGLDSRFARDPELVAMLLDEARLAARLRHPNVVPILDVVQAPGEILLVMDYVHGESLSRLAKAAAAAREAIPPGIAAAVVAGALHGLHAAHEAKDDQGEPIDIVHRDVSPQNIIVGTDGVVRVIDFGVAKAVGRAQTTRGGNLKGKLAYMSPERLQGEATSRQVDVYAAAVVLWEALTGARLFKGENDAEVVESVLYEAVPAPSKRAPNVPPELDAVVLKGLARDPAQRYATALEMALDLEAFATGTSAREVGRWVDRLAHAELTARAARIADREDAWAPAARRRLAAEVAKGAPRRPVGVTRLAAAGALIVAGLIAFAAWRGRDRVDPRPAGPSTVAAVADGGMAAVPAADDELARPSAAVVEPVSRAAPASRPRRDAKPSPPLPSPSSDPCNPPYTVDSKNHRHYKPSCLQ